MVCLPDDLTYTLEIGVAGTSLIVRSERHEVLDLPGVAVHQQHRAIVQHAHTISPRLGRIGS